jgi:hypothetical protein
MAKPERGDGDTSVTDSEVDQLLGEPSRLQRQQSSCVSRLIRAKARALHAAKLSCIAIFGRWRRRPERQERRQGY